MSARRVQLARSMQCLLVWANESYKVAVRSVRQALDAMAGIAFQPTNTYKRRAQNAQLQHVIEFGMLQASVETSNREAGTLILGTTWYACLDKFPVTVVLSPSLSGIYII